MPGLAMRGVVLPGRVWRDVSAGHVRRGVVLAGTVLLGIALLAADPGTAARAATAAAGLGPRAGQPRAAGQAAMPALCGQRRPATAQVRHVIVVMLENRSYRDVVGSASAPFQTQLARACGNATAMFASTHFSAANYLAISAGQYPAAAPGGCGSLRRCASSAGNLYHQLDLAGRGWRGYIESMPSPCASHTSGDYKLGHNPIVFYRDLTAARCRARDVAVPDLTAASGALWRALQNKRLTSFSWVTPDESDDGEGPGTAAEQELAADTWLGKFLALVAKSRSYRAGGTLVLVTYDEGRGADTALGENCTRKSLDMPVASDASAHQDSCHVPLFVVYPYAPAGHKDGTFFDGYSITKTVERLFGLAHLAHAGDAQTTSLIGHFGIPASTKHPGP